MRLSRRHGLFIGIGLLLIFIAVEIQSYAFGKLSIANGNSFQFYQPDVFDLSPEQLANENTASRLGWQLNVPRPQSSELSPSCGSAFGDSMTRGDEVKDDEAWLHRLSERLGCNVQNFGVGGYGLDQAALRYELGTPPGNFVILGLFIEMLRRDMAASWTFSSRPCAEQPADLCCYQAHVRDRKRQAGAHSAADTARNPPGNRAASPARFLSQLALDATVFSVQLRGRARDHRFATLTKTTSTTSRRTSSGRPAIPPHAVALAAKILGRIHDQSKQRSSGLSWS